MNTDGEMQSDAESLPEFSASEDDWKPDEDQGASSILGKRTKKKPKKTVPAKKVPPRATRVSRRIASKLGKELPDDDLEPIPSVLPADKVVSDDENINCSSSSNSDDEEADSKPTKRKVTRKMKKKPTRRTESKKDVEEEQTPIKLTTFTVEQLYRKYRPDLVGGPSTSKKSKKECHKERGDDDGSSSSSSGDDYLVDPSELNLNSDFFHPVEDIDSKKKERIEFDCNAGMKIEESEDEEEDQPLSSVKVEEKETTDFNRKLIQQINQTSQDCMALLRMAEASRKLEDERSKLEKLSKQRSEKAQKSENEDVSNVLFDGEKIKSKSKKQDGRDDFVAVNSKKKEDEQKSVQITIKFESAEKGKKVKKKVDLMTAIKRLMNREKRQNQIHLHKVSILCWIGHGTFLNRTILNPSLAQLATKKLLPSASCRPKGLTNLLYFEQITRYFKKVIKLKNNVMYFRSATKMPPLLATLKYQLIQRAAFSKRDYILLYVIMLRSLNIHCRLVMSLVNPPKHVHSSELYRMNPKTREELEADRRLLLDFRNARKNSTIFKVKEKLAALVLKNSDQTNREAARKRRREGFCATPSIPQLDGSHDFHPPHKPSKSVPNKKLKLMEQSFMEMEQNLRAKIIASSTDKDKRALKKQEEPAFSEDLDEQVRRRREKILAAYQASREEELARARAKKRAQLAKEAGYEIVEEYDAGEGSSGLQLPASPPRKRGRVSAEELARQRRPGVDLWVEVYCEHEDKWVTIDVVSGKVHCLEDIVNHASHPIAYVLAWNNNGTIKDVSPRYISRLGSKKSKLRIEDEWLEKALRPYRATRPSRRDRTEDMKFDKLLNKRPFPEQIAEYKNHPRFALERFLLKTEAIYPPDAVVLGYIKEEPIYPRDCVHVLFSREGWLRQAMTVKMFEKPYKLVKAKAKYDRYTGTTITGQQMELFGSWQVEDYEPPVAKDGLVPRSAYGNVDLFKPCMLPKGTVHLQLPGLNRICKRLRVDCAQAITGFEYRNNMCQAVYDGFVVCEEFRDQVIDEWYQEQVELERKEDEKRKKRVYGNWKRLINGLFIRKKLKDRYNFDNM
ncbi:DNA repair protein complementing XP-C cells homolog [Uranotaenia lowii]|uniref:DNA repair protein complementing XP-C cells homolog n=1 Tax=Uranotaenia lowii TaxID=190385 RepID=UPI002479E268|nr:DNA repair protein complementing XP-C cells homolog [Uranotaenia lowii]